jgi:hypothetical protein
VKGIAFGTFDIAGIAYNPTDANLYVADAGESVVMMIS